MQQRKAWFTPEESAKYSVADQLSSVPKRIMPVAYATPANGQQPLPAPQLAMAMPPPAMPADPVMATIAAAVAPYIAAQLGLPQAPMAWPHGPAAVGGCWPPHFQSPNAPSPQMAVPVSDGFVAATSRCLSAE